MSYNIKYNIVKRCEFGKKSEMEVLPIIKKFFKDELIEPTTKHFDKWDYISKLKNYELKTRTANYKDYPTTMIGLDKCLINSILLFKFVDGLYYIEYNEEQFKKYEVKKFTKYQQKKDYIYIDINDLLLIETYKINNDFLD